MKIPGAASTRCLSAAGFVFLLLSVILSVVGLKGTWGQATFDVAGILSGRGDFTLWEVTLKSEVPEIGWALPDVKVGIDSGVCSGHLEGTKLDEVCGKLHGIRIAVITGLVLAVLADLCASLAFASSLARCIRDRITCAINNWLCLAAIFAFATSVCAVVAVSLALSMPDSERFRDFASPGSGSICTGLLLACSLFGMAFEIACLHSAKVAREMPAEEKTNMSKAPHSPEDAC
eukprot:CAMPEP_0115241584 /NCGR_PEP_ID=MMETSP0270-20121206/38506_1 /TAXON_ID=71861 /ORGANISM="Scrippsiella trochoidea, Strain CCMP3099" /LENGTH=232 /DNA_ID=CAMNT_0002656611 /DNA_START=73 /DNA_END=771 /DNA_ORIENTATION=-